MPGTYPFLEAISPSLTLKKKGQVNKLTQNDNGGNGPNVASHMYSSFNVRHWTADKERKSMQLQIGEFKKYVK